MHWFLRPGDIGESMALVELRMPRSICDHSNEVETTGLSACAKQTEMFLTTLELLLLS